MAGSYKALPDEEKDPNSPVANLTAWDDTRPIAGSFAQRNSRLQRLAMIVCPLLWLAIMLLALRSRDTKPARIVILKALTVGSNLSEASYASYTRYAGSRAVLGSSSLDPPGMRRSTDTLCCPLGSILRSKSRMRSGPVV